MNLSLKHKLNSAIAESFLTNGLLWSNFFYELLLISAIASQVDGDCRHAHGSHHHVGGHGDRGLDEVVGGAVLVVLVLVVVILLDVGRLPQHPARHHKLDENDSIPTTNCLFLSSTYTSIF